MRGHVYVETWVNQFELTRKCWIKIKARKTLEDQLLQNGY